MIDYGFNIKLTGDALKDMQKLADAMKRLKANASDLSSISVGTKNFSNQKSLSESFYRTQKGLENKVFLSSLANQQKLRREEIKGVFQVQTAEIKEKNKLSLERAKADRLELKSRLDSYKAQKGVESKAFLSSLANQQKLMREEIKGVFQVQAAEIRSAGLIANTKLREENRVRREQERTQQNLERARLRRFQGIRDRAMGYIAPNPFTVKNAIVGGLAATGISSIGKSIWENGTFIEDAKIGFKTILGNADKGEKLYNDLYDFSQKTPFTLRESVGMGMRLAPALSQEKIVPTLQMLGTAAKGGMGDLSEITNNYLQGIYKRNVNAVDIKQYANQRVPVSQELEKMLSITKAYKEAGGLENLVSQGRIGSKIIEEAFRRMTSAGGVFFGLLEERAKTASGQWAILQGKFESIAGGIFLKLTPFINSFLDKLKYIADNFERLTPSFKKLGDVFTNTTFGKFFDLFGNFKKSADGTPDIIDRISSAMDTLSTILNGYVNYVLPFQALASSLKVIGSILTLGGLVPLLKGGAALTTVATGAGVAAGTGTAVGIGGYAAAIASAINPIFLVLGGIATTIGAWYLLSKDQTEKDKKNFDVAWGLGIKDLRKNQNQKITNLSGSLIEFGNDGFDLYDKKRQQEYKSPINYDPNTEKLLLEAQNGRGGGAGRAGGISGSTRNLTINFNDALVKVLIEKVMGSDIVDKIKEGSDVAADELFTILRNVALQTR